MTQEVRFGANVYKCQNVQNVERLKTILQREVHTCQLVNVQDNRRAFGLTHNSLMKQMCRNTALWPTNCLKQCITVDTNSIQKCLKINHVRYQLQYIYSNIMFTLYNPFVYNIQNHTSNNFITASNHYYAPRHRYWKSETKTILNRRQNRILYIILGMLKNDRTVNRK